MWAELDGTMKQGSRSRRRVRLEKGVYLIGILLIIPKMEYGISLCIQ